MHIAILTAGGAGMFCGSCMHDNTWAKALMQAGAEVSLIPCYTPLRVDEDNLSESRVFLGGINVYLDYRSKLWRHLPRWFTHLVDHPRLLNLVSGRGVSNRAEELGDLTLSLLAGDEGPHRSHVDELVQHITHLKPDVVLYSNALMVGTLAALKQHYGGPVYCVLQGDDVFLDSLPQSHKQPVIDTLSRKAQQFDGFITHTKFYADHMAEYLDLPRDRFRLLPLGIDVDGHDGVPRFRDGESFHVGYFARIAPEKGLHYLIDAFRQLHDRHSHVRLRIGGYLGPENESYLQELLASTEDRGDAVRYVGSPATHAEKVALLKQFDVISVPTEFLEPKGLYVLESLANGVPVVQPAHGSFPELIESTGGGLLVPPKDPSALAEALERLMHDRTEHHRLAETGHRSVHAQYTMPVMAERTLELLADPEHTMESPAGYRPS